MTPEHRVGSIDTAYIALVTVTLFDDLLAVAAATRGARFLIRSVPPSAS